MAEKFSRSLVEVSEQLSAAEIPWGVFAGAAACAYGSPRPIEDIDILIPSDAGSQVVNCFPHAKLIRDPDGRIAMLKLSGIEIIAGLTEKICLEMDTEMIARLVDDHILGIEVPLLSLEDNLVFKAVLSRGPEVGKHDWADIEDMLACAKEIDWEYVEWRLQNCSSDRFQEIAERLKRIASQ